MKQLKKAVAFILVIAMAVSITACGKETGGTESKSGESKSTSDAKVVNLCMPNLYDVSDIQMIEDAVNEIMEEKYNLKIKLTYVEFGNWSNQSNMLLTGDEADLFCITGTPLTSYVNNGQLLALDEYYNQATAEFKEAISKIMAEENLKCTTIGGQLYALPNCRNHADAIVLEIDETVAMNYSIEPGSKMTLDDVDQLLEKIHSDYPERYTIVPQSGTSMLGAGFSWDGLGDSKYIGVIDPLSQDATVQNLFDMEIFQEFCRYTRQWYEKGYMMADCLSNTENGLTLINGGKAVCRLNKGSWYADIDFQKEGVIRVILQDACAYTTSICDICWGINANTKDKDAAWQMMEILYNDVEVIALLVNGIEGRNYVTNNDGTVSYPDEKNSINSGWGGMSQAWLLPNSSLATPQAVDGAEYYLNLAAFNESAVQSVGFGFSFNNKNVADQYTACVNIMEKYYGALLMGAVSVEDTIDQANQELKDAGFDDVVKEKQEQFDSWQAEQ